MFKYALLLLICKLYCTSGQEVSPCSLGLNQKLPLSTTHTYFFQCLERNADGHENVLLSSCIQVSWKSNVSGIASVTQFCGNLLNSYVLMQSFEPNFHCLETVETHMMLSMNGNISYA